LVEQGHTSDQIRRLGDDEAKEPARAQLDDDSGTRDGSLA
jgi:hypothetical protein